MPPSNANCGVKKMQISSAEQMNPQKRNTMEDSHVIQHANNPQWSHDSTFIGCYDGHGGRDIVEFLEDNLHSIICQELNHDDDAPIYERLERSFLMADVQSKLKNIQTSGSTVAICIIEREIVSKDSNDEKCMRIKIHAANAGDARAVLSCKPSLLSSEITNDQGTTKLEGKNTTFHDRNDATTIRLTEDHKADDPSEVERIENAGGFFMRNRVLGIMAVARSLGDHGMKEFVTAKPYVRSIEFCLDLNQVASCENENCTNEPLEDREFIILACDGLWDTMEDHEAVDIVRKFLKIQQDISNNNGSQPLNTYDLRDKAAQILCKEALKRGTTDNVTALVAWF